MRAWGALPERVRSMEARSSERRHKRTISQILSRFTRWLPAAWLTYPLVHRASSSIACMEDWLWPRSAAHFGELCFPLERFAFPVTRPGRRRRVPCAVCNLIWRYVTKTLTVLDPRAAFVDVGSELTLSLIDVVHNHSITRLVLTGSRASFPRTSSG